MGLQSLVANNRDTITKDSNGDSAQRVVIGNQPINVTVTNNNQYNCAIAGENISALKCLVQSTGNVLLAEPDTHENATVLGISISAGSTGNEVKYVIAGELYDTAFTFALNEQLYLSTNGTITNVAPVSGFRTKVGFSLGPGAIMVQIEEPIQL